MWSLLAALGSFSFASMYYCFLISYYTWMMLPVAGTTLAAYKFYSFYQTTTEDRYMHSKLTTASRRRAGQAASEFVDWVCDLVRALSSVSFVGTLVRSRLGITKKAPSPTIRPSSSQRIRDVKASLQAAATCQAGGIPRTRSLKRHDEPTTLATADDHVADSAGVGPSGVPGDGPSGDQETRSEE